MRPIVVTTTDASGGATTSALVRLDEWVPPGQITIQSVVVGTVAYTVQYSVDDPNSPTNPVAVGSMTWTDSGQGSKSATNTFQLLFPVLFLKVVQASGSGSTTTTILQNGSVTY